MCDCLEIQPGYKDVRGYTVGRQLGLFWVKQALVLHHVLQRWIGSLALRARVSLSHAP